MWKLLPEALVLQPAGALRRDDRHGSWSAPGGPAAFRVDRARLLSNGWYVLSFSIECSEGSLASAGLVLRSADGEARHTIPLRLSVGARQRLLFRIDRPAVPESIVVSARPCRFCLGRVRLRRIVGLEAIARLAWPAVPRPLASREGLQFMRNAATSLLSLRSLRAIEGRAVAAGAHARAGAGSVTYDQWLQHWQADMRDVSRERSKQATRMRNRPLFSILVPVFNPPRDLLEQCIESVIRQSYRNWELCIADDASTLPHVREVLLACRDRDARIRVEFRERTGHISAATNTALSMARGDYVGLLDHDDLLADDALAWVATTIEEHPGTRVVYTDEDKIDPAGRRFDPYFKPEFNLELLRGQNMVSHFGVYATSLVREVGGFREGLEGSQDHDLVLRCAERLQRDEIRHVPVVLYHWRATIGSTAQSGAAKPYAALAGERAVREHLVRCGQRATVEPLRGGLLRVRYEVPQPEPSVAIVVPTRDGLEYLRPCIESVLGLTAYENLSILIIDNGSVEAGTLEWLDQVGRERRARVLRIDEPFNFARLNNLAIAGLDAEFICLLNNDTEVLDAHWLGAMVAQAAQPGVGAVGAMLVHPDRSIQHAGLVIGAQGIAAHAYEGMPLEYPGQMGRLMLAQDVGAVTAACMLVRRSDYLGVGGMDELLAVAFNDVDFCLRIRQAGLRVVWTPLACLLHRGSATRGRDGMPERAQRLLREQSHLRRTWGALLEGDPAYNPNLSLGGEPFTLDLVRRPPAAAMPSLSAATRIPPPERSQ